MRHIEWVSYPIIPVVNTMLMTTNLKVIRILIKDLTSRYNLVLTLTLPTFSDFNKIKIQDKTIHQTPSYQVPIKVNLLVGLTPMTSSQYSSDSLI